MTGRPVESVLCWDIDGTLLTTGRAGIGAWEQAVLETTGSELRLAEFRTAGLTDVEIARLLAGQVEASPRPELVEEIVSRYEAWLPIRLHDRRGQVLPGVLEILTWNHERKAFPSLLLTGNTAGGAAAKLNHYGLDAFFDVGAFASFVNPDRVSIAREAARLARELVGTDLSPARLVVIGDTPHDVACGKAVGARTLAVATGTYTVAELEATSPWRVLPGLPDPEGFAKLVE
ncbi:MAG: haloacid dehalogenase-like hydrolase [Longimicrobiales bacterium]